MACTAMTEDNTAEDVPVGEPGEQDIEGACALASEIEIEAPGRGLLANSN